MLENFLLNGFATGIMQSDLAFLFKRFQFADCNDGDSEIDPEAVNLLNALHSFISNTYVSPLFSEYTIARSCMWTGVDSLSKDWHNDNCAEFNSNFLIYLDDGETYGNSIEIKTPSEEFKIYPKKNQFVWLNQDKKFLHRATHVSGPRRLLSFEFKIPAIP